MKVTDASLPMADGSMSCRRGEVALGCGLGGSNLDLAPTHIRMPRLSCAITGRDGDEALVTGFRQPPPGLAMAGSRTTRQSDRAGAELQKAVKPCFPRIDRRNPS